jgi:GAF domain-containing protein
MFSFRLQSQFIDYRQVFYAECQQYLVKMNRLAACRKDLRSNLHDFHLLFGQATGAEYLSLAVLDRYRKNMRRFTIGRDGKILLENGSTLPVENTQIDNVIESCRSMIIDDVTLVSDGDVDSLFKSCGLRSLAALPIVNDGRVICTITLGHPAVGHFNRRHLVLAETLAAGMAPAVEAEIARRVTFERDRYLGAIASFDLTVQKCTNLKDIYDAAADLLLENIGTTIVRISTLNRKNSTLVTRAIRTIRPFDDINLEPHGVSRHLTRWHQMVIEENRPLLINQSDPESSMDDVEARALVFKGMQSALIVPISVNGLIYGLITLGEMRVWERFSYQPSTIVFCREIAARIANGIKMLMFSRALLKSDKNRVRPVSERAVDAVEGHFMQDLKSQVTTIRGSLDLLKLKGMDQSEKTDRIISTMDKSANRIITLMNEERETVPS